ncbi:MAG TPA: PAS domain S-box protein [Thermomicrobiales bacterium]|nr:PAS domain S-box protein [Thermomicrobiales bacterium]
MSQDSSPAVDARLIESEERYRAVIENASDMIQSIRPDGTFEFVNSSWLKAFGYSREEVAGLNIWDIVYPDSVEHCQLLFSRAIQGEPIGYMEATFKTKDGRPLPVEGNVTSRFVGDTVVATHGFFRDISERIRARELEEQNIRLEQEQQARYLEKMAALGKLSAGLAHELNNPAAAVQRANAGLEKSVVARDACMKELISMGMAAGQWQAIDTAIRASESDKQAGVTLNPLEISDQESAVEDWLADRGVKGGWDIAPGLVHAGIREEHLDQLAAALPGPVLATAIGWLAETLTIRESIDIIGRSSHRISELVTAIKGYTHMDRATEQFVDIHDGLENTLIILGHRLQNVTIERSYDRAIPPVRVFGNTLNQVWTNILDNAIDAMHGKGNIAIRTRREGDRVVVEIEDNGSGIAPADLACIFEPFFTTKSQGYGTGLGLDTAWRIVTEEHRGTILAESEPGRTVFRTTLPIASPSGS